MKYDIYIKGCYGKEDNSASLSFVLVVDGKIVERRAAKFDNYIRTRGGYIAILKNRGQFQAELCALAWALYYAKEDADIDVYTNNSAVAGWLLNGHVPADYADLHSVCLRLAGDRTMTAKWIAKKDGNNFNKIANDVAFELIKLKGSPITKIF